MTHEPIASRKAEDDAAIDRHNVTQLWQDVVGNLEAARDALEQAGGALEDLTDTYGVDHTIDVAFAEQQIAGLLDDAKAARRS